MSKKTLISNRHSQKIKLLAVGAILFAFGVATSAVATSAWYNLLDIAVVSNLNLKIDVSDAKLELGLVKGEDNTIWLDEEHPDGFSKEELGITDTVLTDVSGMFESEWRDEVTPSSNPDLLPKFHTRYRPTGVTTNTGFITQEEAEKNIVQVEFVFKSEKYDMDVYLDQSTSFAANGKMNFDKAKEKANDPNDSNEVNRIKDKLDQVIYATRLSFLTTDYSNQNYEYLVINPYKGLSPYIEVDGSEEVETYYGGVLDLNKDGFYDYNAESRQEILYGQFKDSSKAIPTLGKGDSEDDHMKDVTRYNTFQGEHKKDIEVVDWLTAKDNVVKEDSKSLKQVVFDEKDPLKDTPICRVKAGESKRVIMSIYVEGWDRHMTDDIASASFDVNIAFTGLVK